MQTLELAQSAQLVTLEHSVGGKQGPKQLPSTLGMVPAKH
jgi:hypothetical protein